MLISLLFGNSWSILILCKYPEYQQKIRDEIIANAGESGFPKPDQLAKMTLLNNCLQETLRVKSPVPFLSFSNCKELEYQGSVFPAGTQFWTLQRKMINDSVPDGAVFKPERWSDPNMTKDGTTTKKNGWRGFLGVFLGTLLTSCWFCLFSDGCVFVEFAVWRRAAHLPRKTAGAN